MTHPIDGPDAPWRKGERVQWSEEVMKEASASRDGAEGAGWTIDQVKKGVRDAAAFCDCSNHPDAPEWANACRFAAELLRSIDSLSPSGTGAAEPVVWQYRVKYDLGSPRQDEWCDWHDTTKKYYDHLCGEVERRHGRLEVRALYAAPPVRGDREGIIALVGKHLGPHLAISPTPRYEAIVRTFADAILAPPVSGRDARELARTRGVARRKASTCCPHCGGEL